MFDKEEHTAMKLERASAQSRTRNPLSSNSPLYLYLQIFIKIKYHNTTGALCCHNSLSLSLSLSLVFSPIFFCFEFNHATKEARAKPVYHRLSPQLVRKIQRPVVSRFAFTTIRIHLPIEIYRRKLFLAY